MPHWLIYGAAITGRILAFLAGCIFFYYAFFLYKDEEDRWQNRIDELWLRVDDRSKLTDSVTIALFNKIADVLVNAANRIFGHRLLSLRMFSISINLSISGASLCSLVVALVSREYGDRFIQTLLFGSALYFVIMVSMALTAIRFPRPIVSAATLVPFVTFYCVSASYLAHYIKQLGTSWDALIPGVVLSIFEMLSGFLLFSIISDAVAVVAIRKVFLSISKSLSFASIMAKSLLLIAVTVAVLPGPLLFLNLVGSNVHSLRFKSFTDIGRVSIVALNATTVFYLIIPVLMLIGMLVHKILWPTLARIFYAMSQKHFLVNSKSLATLSTLCFIYAFNLDKIAAKEFFKLF